MQLLTFKNKSEVAEFTLRVIRSKELMGLGKWPQAATLNDLQLRILSLAIAKGFDYLDSDRKFEIATELGITRSYMSKKLGEMREAGILTANYNVPSSLIKLMARSEWMIQFKLILEDGSD